jgi:exodeoxyribonuclease VII small subunit
LASLKFESSLTRLEDLVGKLEQGDLSLEESLKVFEEGVRLSKNCTKILNDAEKKVEMLMRQRATCPAESGTEIETVPE